MSDEVHIFPKMYIHKRECRETPWLMCLFKSTCLTRTQMFMYLKEQDIYSINHFKEKLTEREID